MNTLDGREFTYPIFLDLEQSQAQMETGKELLTFYVVNALDRIKEAGYTCGIYIGYSWIDNYIDTDIIINSGYEVWMARYPYADKVANPLDYNYSDTCSIWQYSSSMKYDSVPNAYVDTDISYIDYGSGKRISSDFDIGIPYVRPRKELYYNTKTLMKGSGVKWLQYALNVYGKASLTVDGKFGTATENALIKYQKDNELKEDGICSEEVVYSIVKEALDSKLSEYASSEFVFDYLLNDDNIVLRRDPDSFSDSRCYIKRYCVHETEQALYNGMLYIDFHIKECCAEYYYECYDLDEYGNAQNVAVLKAGLNETSENSIVRRIEILQNYLINKNTVLHLNNIDFDMNCDGSINVFDLCILKSLYKDTNTVN